MAVPSNAGTVQLVTKETQTVIIAELEKKVLEWIKWDRNDGTRKAIQHLNDTNKTSELLTLLLGRMEFGTAGLRGRMGPGYTQMNDLVIIQTTQGVVSYLEKSGNLEAVKKGGVAIGYDGRHNSKRFAQLTASIFLHKGFRVHLFTAICPTPFVPFCVTTHKCVAGIMITASHNPKEDNGYKVYWGNGAQIIPPHDKLIQTEIMGNLKPWATSWDTTILVKSELLNDPLSVIMSSYFSILRGNMVDLAMNHSCGIKITYTAMHGVGYEYMKAGFRAAQLKSFVEVSEQIHPDPEFPTVKFPNPEEGKSALDLAMATADMNDSTLILANDPDADRLAAAEKISANKWRIFTGNELGALLGWWSLFSYKERNPGVELKNVYMLGSTVSSKFLKTMAKVEGFNFVETLTGFKWMGNRACKLIAQGKVVLFAFEEAIGFMCGTAVLDKDGISAGIHTAELAAYLEKKKLTFDLKLDQLYNKYGYHLSENSYFICEDPAVVKLLFQKLRTRRGEPNTYPDSLKKGKFKIIHVRDLTTGYDSARVDKVAVLPSSSSSQMITFYFANGVEATLRTSGTEPKVKYYTEMIAPPENTNLRRLHSILKEMVELIIAEFLQPEVYGLIPRKE